MSVKWSNEKTPEPTPKAIALPSINLSGAGVRLAKVALVAVVIVAIFAAVIWLDAASPISGQIESAGRAYPHQLGVAYAAAWEDGARMLDAGQPIEKALGQVKTTWDKGRTEAFTSTVSPLFSRVLPEGTPEKDITAEDRQRLARAWLEFARGLGK